MHSGLSYTLSNWISREQDGEFVPSSALVKRIMALPNRTGSWRPAYSVAPPAGARHFNLCTPRRLRAILPRSMPICERFRPTRKQRLPGLVSRPSTSSGRLQNAKMLFTGDVLCRVSANGKRLNLHPRLVTEKAIPKQLSRARMQRKIGLPNLFDQKIQGRERKTATQPKMTKNIKRKDSTDKKPLLVSDEPGPVQQTVVSAGLMTEEQIEDLMSREITPEDFALLLQLDELNDKKYKTVQKSILDRFERMADLPADIEGKYECRVCLEALASAGPEVDEGESHGFTKLPCCERMYHDSCIKMWLGDYSKSCPSCRQVLAV